MNSWRARDFTARERYVGPFVLRITSEVNIQFVVCMLGSMVDQDVLVMVEEYFEIWSGISEREGWKFDVENLIIVFEF